MPDSFIQRISQVSHGKRVYIIPTSIGFYFSFIAFVLFLIAISYGHNLAFYCTFLFFSFVSFSAVIANESIKKIEIKSSEEKVLVRNNSFSQLKITVENTSRRSQFDLLIESQGVVVGFIEEIKPLEKKNIHLDMSLLELPRGVYQLSRLTISTRFPLGLFYSWKYRPINNLLKVLPKPIEGQLHTSTTHEHKTSSAPRITLTTGTEEYVETREHRTGDGVSRVDQKRSMLLGSPQVRTYSDESGFHECLDLRNGDIEDNLSRATYYFENHHANSSLSLILPDGFKTIATTGAYHHQYLLELLSEFKKEKIFLQ